MTQAGFVAIDPATGQVKAWCRSRDSRPTKSIIWAIVRSVGYSTGATLGAAIVRAQLKLFFDRRFRFISGHSKRL